MMHWAYKYIGTPWSPNGFGPNDFNCWGLVCHVLSTRFDKPLMLLDNQDNSRAIREMIRRSVQIRQADLEEADVVTMSSNIGRHAGIMIQADRRFGILHASGYLTYRPVGQVIFEPLDNLLSRGMKNVEYWRYV